MRAKEVWGKLPKVDLIEKNMELFWTFVCERQNIWYKRFVLKEPPPWTKDPILRDYKFTNVYRELDYGTIWYMDHIVAPSIRREETLSHLVWKTILYRLINRTETFEEVGIVDYLDWPMEKERWKKKFMARQKRGECIVTNAHLTLTTPIKGQSKIERYFVVLDALYGKLRNLTRDIRESETLETVFDLLTEVPCVGRFIAYEVCCDLMLAQVIHFTENDWVNPGPGCKRGINLIWPKVDKVHDYQLCIRILTTEQKKYFKQYDLYFHRYNHQDMTLRGIEHSLCEFQKYYKMIHKVGKQRMYFKPRDWPSAQGQLRFPR